MSFQNSFGPDGSININVVPSFGRIVQLPEQQKVVTVHIRLPRSQKLKHGELEKVPWDKDLQTLTQADIFLSVLEKSLKIQLINRTFTIMSKDPDLAEDSDFDYLKHIQ